MAGTARAALAQGRLMAAAANAAEGALAAALAFAAGLLVWTIVAPGSVAPANGSALAAARPASSSPVFDRSILWRADLFGRATAAVEAAPETTLNLTLFGVAASVGDAPGSAVIRTPDNRQTVFREGDPIIDGVTLERVLADRVVIRRGGVAETLFFPNARRPEAVAPAAPAAAEPVTPDALYSAMDLEAVFRGGRAEGLRIRRAYDAALLAQAGLAEGDIVVEVAGRAVADIADPGDLFERLRGAESAAFVVERNGAQLPLTISFGTLQ